MKVISREAAEGRAWGGLIVGGFGTVWLLGSLSILHRLSWGSAILCICAGASVVAMALLLMRRARALPSGTWSEADGRQAKRLFRYANIAQWVAIAAALLALNMLQLQNYIAPAIGVIVGLHFFPMAIGFQYRQHFFTGALLVCWCAGCMAFLAGERMAGISALGNGCILLVSVVVTLTTALSHSSNRLFVANVSKA